MGESHARMPVVDRIYFGILIPVSLVVLITIMAYYTHSEMDVNRQLEQEIAKQMESKTSSDMEYERCTQELKTAKAGVAKLKTELAEEGKKKKEIEEQWNKCESEV